MGLGVDDNVATTWKLDDEIRDEASLIRRRRALFNEVAVVEHACHLDDAAQLHLAPPASYVRCSQGALQVRRRDSESAQLFRQLRVRSGPLFLDLVELRVDLR